MKPQSAGGMTKYLSDTCFVGDCREVLKTLIAEDLRVQMCVTSPPYWGLRDYGMAGQIGLERTLDDYVTVRHIVARQNVAFPNGLHRIMLSASRAFPSLQYASGTARGGHDSTGEEEQR